MTAQTRYPYEQADQNEYYVADNPVGMGYEVISRAHGREDANVAHFASIAEAEDFIDGAKAGYDAPEAEVVSTSPAWLYGFGFGQEEAYR